MQKLLTPDEVAEILAVTAKVVRGWLRDEKLPGLRLGRLWRIRETDLETFIGGAGFTEAAKRSNPRRSTRTTKKTRETRSGPARKRNKR